MSSGVKSTNKNEYDPSIIAKNLKLVWAGDFHSVKSMVAEYLELDGEWVSLGGEKKFLCGRARRNIFKSKVTKE